MATAEECAQALEQLAKRLDEVEPEARRKYALDRTVSCKIRDLDVYWSTELHDGAPGPLVEQRRSDAQVRVSLTSDDLLALVEGRLKPATAFASGRLRIEASMMDLLRLRSLL